MTSPANSIPISSEVEPAPIATLRSASVVEMAAVEVTETIAPHEVERVLTQRLQAHPSLRFTRLSVHQCSHDSVCLEGFMESNDDNIDLCDVIRGIHGINSIVNRVIIAHPERPVPRKG